MKKSKNKKVVQDKNVKVTQNKSLETKLNEFEIKDKYVIIFFAVITFLFFREILLQQKFLWLDFLDDYYPWRNFAAVILSQGILPHWNPYTLGGMPFIADIQTSVFYPLHLLLTIFVTDDKLPFAVSEYLLIVHYFMAGVFSYYLSRSLDLNKWASILSGITFMFCSFMVTHAIHETMIITFTYMPLVFMFYNKGLSTSKLKYVLLTGLFMGIVILCGHPQITLYIFFTFFLFGLYQIFFKFKESNYKIDVVLFRFIVITAIPFILGIMISAIQLLPTIKLLQLSIRTISYEESLFGSLNYHNLLTLFFPKFFGEYNTAKDAFYWGHKDGYMYLETCIYVGLSALVFGIFGIIAVWKKRIIKFLAVISLFSILYILGDNFIIHKFFYNFVPGFNNVRFIGRFLLVFAFAFSLLSAYGFDYFIKNAESEKVKKFIKCLIILISGFILLWLLYIAGIFENLIWRYKNDFVTKGSEIITGIAYKNSITQLTITIIILSVLFGLIILYKKKIILQQIILFLFVLLSFADFYVFGSQLNNGITTPEKYYYSNKEIIDHIKQDYKKELSRVTDVIDYHRKLIKRSHAMTDFVFMIDGMSPLAIKDKFPPYRTNELMNVKIVAVVPVDKVRVKLTLNENYTPRAWMSYYPIVESSLEKVAKILEDTTFDIRTKVIIDQEPEVYINKALMGGGYG
jgi:hypothetical protein